MYIVCSTELVFINEVTGKHDIITAKLTLIVVSKSRHYLDLHRYLNVYVKYYFLRNYNI